MWKVVPIQGRQLRDVNKKDLFGDFRLCDTYKGGGGYDQFSHICAKRLGIKNTRKQFVVQLYGCPLNCYYCYVTTDGIYGEYKEYTTDELINCFNKSKQKVFHLMGGAPAIYLDQWSEIVDKLPNNKVFHSDLMLIESDYDIEWLKAIKKRNVLLAVNIKGVNKRDFKENTGKSLNEVRLWKNLDVVVKSGVNFYITFTNPDFYGFDLFKSKISRLYGPKILDDHYVINLIKYEACKENWDRRSYGGQKR